MQALEAPYLLCLDSDGQCDPKDFWKLWDARNDADVVMGWRVDRADTRLRRSLSRFFYLLYQAVFRVPVHDPSCPYVLARKEVIKRLMPELGAMQQGFWWEFVARTHRRGYSIKELPIHHRLRRRSDPGLQVSQDAGHLHPPLRCAVQDLVSNEGQVRPEGVPARPRRPRRPQKAIRMTVAIGRKNYLFRKREWWQDGSDALHAGASQTELRGRVALPDRRAASNCGHRRRRHGRLGSPVAGSLAGRPSRASAGAAGGGIPRGPGPSSPETGQSTHFCEPVSLPAYCCRTSSGVD